MKHLTFSTRAYKRCRHLMLAGASASTLLLSAHASAYTIGETNPGKWGSYELGTGATIRWSYVPSGPSCRDNPCVSLASFMPEGFEQVIKRGFEAWAKVADLTFIQVEDAGVDTDARSDSDIRIAGTQIDGRTGGQLAYAFYPPKNGPAAGDIHFDALETWSLGPSMPGYSIFNVFTHELGHALGLGHTDVPNSLMNATYSTAFYGPQPDDIAGMQRLYGLPKLDNSTVAVADTLPAFMLGLLLLGRKRQRS